MGGVTKESWYRSHKGFEPNHLWTKSKQWYM